MQSNPSKSNNRSKPPVTHYPILKSIGNDGTLTFTATTTTR